LSDRPIFVLGCPRSGTTLVQVMLHGHPKIAIPPENRYVMPLYRRRRRFGDLEERANREAVAEFILERRRRFRDLGLSRKRTRALIADGPPTIGSAIGVVLRAYAERFERPRWGDKRPHYTHFVEPLLRMFPDAQLVHVIRDPRDCVASLKRAPWWKRSTYHGIATWAAAIDNVDEASRRWPGVVIPVRYERLVSDPEAEAKVLCASLGEAYEPAMIDPGEAAAVAVPERKHWHAYTRVPPTTERIGGWHEGLERWEASLCDAVLGDRMRAFGYETARLGRPGAAHLLRYARARAERKAVHARWTLQDRWDRRREPNPVGALLTSGQLAAAARRGGEAVE
jgi:hypothetical protein